MNKPQNKTLGVRMTDYENQNSFGFRMRRKRTIPLIKLIEEAHARFGHVKLLDVGGRKLYWNILPDGFLRKNNVSITLLNLAIDLNGADDEIFKHVAGNACDMSEFPDKSFHIAHSNSVIEHVGGWRNVKKFANETRRVANGLFIQTPNFWFPVEPHYVMPLLHWCPRPIQETILLKLPLGHKGRKAASLDAAITEVDDIPRLIDLRAYRLLYPDCTFIKERFFLMTKSIVAFRQIS